MVLHLSAEQEPTFRQLHRGGKSYVYFSCNFRFHAIPNKGDTIPIPLPPGNLLFLAVYRVALPAGYRYQHLKRSGILRLPFDFPAGQQAFYPNPFSIFRFKPCL